MCLRCERASERAANSQCGPRRSPLARAALLTTHEGSRRNVSPRRRSRSAPHARAAALEVLDHCAIYVLIAGCYSPFLTVLFHPHKPAWSVALHAVLWSIAAAGIIFSAGFHGSPAIKTSVEITLYLSLGWSIMLWRVVVVLTPVAPAALASAFFARFVCVSRRAARAATPPLPASRTMIERSPPRCAPRPPR